MRWCLEPVRRACSSFALVLALGPAACASATPHGPIKVPEGPITPAMVNDAEFAESVHKLLRDGVPSTEREALLIGVIRRQLAHAAERFAGGHERRATESVIGALYLVRSGEGRGEMVDAVGERALAGAIEHVSPRGDEGQAETLMRMRLAALPPGSPDRKELEEHLAALELWMKDTRTGGPLEKLGAEERAAVSRALVDPRPEALEQAAGAIDRWIQRAIEYNIELRQGRPMDRNEALEMQRAMDTGGATMASVFLRHGDAQGAFDHIERSSTRRIISPAFFDRIRRAAEGGAQREWQGLLVAYMNHDFDENHESDGFQADATVLDAAVWGTALEAFRHDTTFFGSAMVVSRNLIGLGLPEAAPLVLADGLGKDPPANAVAGSMAILIEALEESAQIDDPETARRTFAAAGAILGAADRKPGRPGDPSAARARFTMASIELATGNITGARPLLEAAVAADPRAAGYNLLATLERQAGNPAAALLHVDQALAAPDARMAPLDLVEAELLAFEIYRDGGAPEKAKRALDTGLGLLLAVRGRLQPPAGPAGSPAAARARVERLLGRVLDSYGDTKGATRALERALTAAAEDRPLLAATVLDAIGRALVRKDVSSARIALKKGIDGDVAEEDLVYGGLWLMLLEKEQRVTTDGTAERALRAAGHRGSWTGKLAAWASGKLSEQALRTAAHNVSQRIEANFYTALASKVAGDPNADARLRDVAKSPVIELVEVQIARDLVAPNVRTELPGNIALP